MKKIIALLLACMMVVGLFAACGEGKTTPTNAPAQNNDATKPAATEAQAEAEPEEITLTVWGPQEDQVDENSFLQVACAKFAEQHPEWKITWSFGVSSEGDAGKNVSQDPSAAADVYMFANDQLGTLIQANAIAKLGGDVLEQVKSTNSEAMIKSVSDANGNVYGVPFTGNTWFLYYDKSVYTEDDIKSLDTMMEKGVVAFPVTNTWYLPSFYFAVGGTMFGDGTDGAAGITFGGEQGAKATTYVAEALASGKLIDDASGAGLDGLRNGSVAAMFSGTWDAKSVADALGENYGAAQLPCITIDGEQMQMKSFSGSKALGVNPNSKNMKAAYALAAWLGSAEMQALHYELRDGGVVPCNTELLASDEFSSNPAALAQNDTIANTSVLQPSIPEMGAYWSNAESMGKGLANGEITAANALEKTDLWNEAINNTGL